MGIIDKLKQLTQDIDADKLEYYNGKYKVLSEAITKALSGEDKEKSANEIFDNLDFMLQYTALFNKDWLVNDLLFEKEEYIDKLIDNLDSFKYKNYLPQLIYGNIRVHALGRYPNIIEKIYSSKMFEKLFGYNLDEDEYIVIFEGLNPTQQRIFINTLVEGKFKINFYNYSIPNENIDLINDNIDYIMDLSKNIYKVQRKLESNEKVDIQRVNEYIDKHQDKALDSLLKMTEMEKSSNTIKEVIRLLILDIVDNEKCKLSDIKINNSGAFSSVLIIGDKVMKIGFVRANKNFPNNPYVIKPLLRKTLKTGDSECFIEVTERVIPFEVDAYKENPELKEELYELYKKVRDSGLIWTDVRMDNVGRLLKDNDQIYWKDPIEPSDEILEYNGKIDGEPLKKGELVILDADHIHCENDKDILCPVSAFRELFEARYQNEKVSSKRKGFSTLKLLTAISISTTLIVSMFITYMFMQ